MSFIMGQLNVLKLEIVCDQKRGSKESYKLIHCPLQTLPSISSADLSLSTTDTDFLHTTTSF